MRRVAAALRCAARWLLLSGCVYPLAGFAAGLCGVSYPRGIPLPGALLTGR